MQEKEQRAVINARQAWAEASLKAEGLMLLLHRWQLVLPVHTKGGIGQHVVKLFGLVLVLALAVAQRVAQSDIFHVFAFDEHVGTADGP